MRKALNLIIYALAGVGLFFILGYLVVYFGLTNTPGGIDLGRRFTSADQAPIGTTKTYPWNQGEEWQALETAIIKDARVIEQASKVAGIDPRLLTACLLVEQLRLFHSEREVFKQVFYPLAILGTQSQFSWGVMGMKRETAITVEENLKNQKSPFYLGSRYENLLNFQTADPEAERFSRLVDEHDHYWSYLYSALYLKQIMTQWEKLNFPINNKIGVLATLFNIGFNNSKPNNAPQVGGAIIEINKTEYTFGGLAEEFYFSNELTDNFPIVAGQ